MVNQSNSRQWERQYHSVPLVSLQLARRQLHFIHVTIVSSILDVARHIVRRSEVKYILGGQRQLTCRSRIRELIVLIGIVTSLSIEGNLDSTFPCGNRHYLLSSSIQINLCLIKAEDELHLLGVRLQNTCRGFCINRINLLQVLLSVTNMQCGNISNSKSQFFLSYVERNRLCIYCVNAVICARQQGGHILSVNLDSVLTNRQLSILVDVIDNAILLNDVLHLIGFGLVQRYLQRTVVCKVFGHVSFTISQVRSNRHDIETNTGNLQLTLCDAVLVPAIVSKKISSSSIWIFFSLFYCSIVASFLSYDGECVITYCVHASIGTLNESHLEGISDSLVVSFSITVNFLNTSNSKGNILCSRSHTTLDSLPTNGESQRSSSNSPCVSERNDFVVVRRIKFCSILTGSNYVFTIKFISSYLIISISNRGDYELNFVVVFIFREASTQPLIVNLASSTLKALALYARLLGLTRIVRLLALLMV